MSSPAVLPTLYEYYTTPSVVSGLSDAGPHFTLNGKNITLYSGAMHYFRVPRQYWRDRLRKMRAAGLNAVETYVPWNLHEPEPGVYDFGQGGTDFEDLLHIQEFLTMAKEEDLFAIVRPGPYICAEWDFGGMPSWLLREDGVKVRTSDASFMDPVRRYFEVLFGILSVVQFTKGGSVIAFQIENEYGNVKVPGLPIDGKYLELLVGLARSNGLVELLFTSDTPSKGKYGSVPGVLYTANFQNDSITELNILRSYQKDKPFMVMEYWTGWFDHWGEYHHTRATDTFSKVLEEILSYPSSVNFYMFHGGTNWGFLNGGNFLDNSTDNGGTVFDVSSYDYDAPLSEAGDYTEKYHSAKSIIAKHNTISTRLPPMPKESRKVAYKTISVTHSLRLEGILQQTRTSGTFKRPVSMEHHKVAQSYGYIVYRKRNVDIPPGSRLRIGGRVCDTLMVLIDGVPVTKPLKSAEDLNSFGYWKVKNATLSLPKGYYQATLDLVVENFGRANFGNLTQFNQKKGLWQDDVYLNDGVLTDWDVHSLDFKRKWTQNLKYWETPSVRGPALHKSTLAIEGKPVDTFLDMRGWGKGVIVVNGFVLSRYFRIGPQQTAYLPAPFLRSGDNEVLIFEHFDADENVKFSAAPINETQ